MATTKAFVLIETAVGKTKDVVNLLNEVDGVTSVDVVTGPYDVICIVEAEDLSAVGDTVTGSVHTIGGIVRTVTCLAVGPSIGGISSGEQGGSAMGASPPEEESSSDALMAPPERES